MSFPLRFSAALLFPAAFICLTSSELNGQTSDTTPPVLTNLTFTPASVDVTLSARTVTFQVSATDNLSGLNQASVTLTSPSGAQWQTGWGFFLSPGPPLLNGIVDVPVTIPRYAEAGTWKVSLVIYDRTNNPSIYSTAVLNELGYPTIVGVIDSTPDLTAPVLTAVAMTPASVDVSAGPVNVQVDLTITDAVSGVSHQLITMNDFVVSSPTGRQSLPLAGSQFNLVSGTINSGVWRATVQIPRYAEAGVWKMTSVYLRDAANNSRYYLESNLADFGPSINLSVASAIQDLLPPSPRAIRFIPAFVNTSLGAQRVTVELDVTDNLAGVRFAPSTPSISWIHGPFAQSPSGVQYSYVSPFGGWSLVSGGSLNGTWRGAFTLPQYSEEGTWHVQRLRLEDEARNAVYLLSGAEVEALGLTSTFVVIKPSLQTDGSVTSAGGTVQDSLFGSRASITLPAGAVSTTTTVAIDVLQSPLDVPIPSGFSGADTFFVNIELTPQPAYPLPPPGMTVVLPLKVQMTPGTAIYLFRIDPATGTLVPSLNTSSNPVIGAVNADGNSASFSGVSRLSTVVGLRPTSIQLQIDVKPGDVVNSVNLGSRGVIPVLIYGTATLDASELDLSTLRLAGAAVASTPRGNFLAAKDDFNGDGYRDLMVHFDTAGLQLISGATTVRLDGRTLDLRMIWGQDSIRLVR